MIQRQPVRQVVDLTSPEANVIFDMEVDAARALVASGDPARVAQIEGHFALVATEGHLVRMARSLAIPLRYFVAKREAGPALVAANRISVIRDWLNEEGLGDQFHPSYTRMVPAHHLTEVALVGCPDPNPTHQRFFTPKRERLGTDVAAIGTQYVRAAAAEITRWLQRIPDDAPIGVLFSGGIDSGAVFLLTHHCLLESGMSPARLKAFTLSLTGDSSERGGAADLRQARSFLESLGLGMFLEPIEVGLDQIDLRQTIRVLEDYKPLDVQAGAMTYLLCREIRARYLDWTYLIDGDGGDENFKDYPIEENPELTIRSVLNNPLLYHEGWGVDAIKHSLTYSGGLSRACTRGYAPQEHFGFRGFSPLMLPSVIAVSEGIGFIELTVWDHQRLYALKGQAVAAGVEAVTGMRMPVFAKRRLQHGAVAAPAGSPVFPESPNAYRRMFHEVFDL
ncbi:MAG: asparagine synthase-related protein [Phycisphaerae bacterium]